MAETIEECWDEDAEARLPAHCVERRFQETLMSLYSIGNKTQSKLSLASLNSIAPKSNVIYLPESAETDSGASVPLSPNEEDSIYTEANRQGLHLSPTNGGHAQERDSGTALEEVVDLPLGTVLCNTMARDNDEE